MAKEKADAMMDISSIMSPFRQEQFDPGEQRESVIQDAIRDPFGDVTEDQVAADMAEIERTDPKIFSAIAESQAE